MPALFHGAHVHVTALRIGGWRRAEQRRAGHFDEYTGHLSEGDLEYLRRWERMVALEFDGLHMQQRKMWTAAAVGATDRGLAWPHSQPSIIGTMTPRRPRLTCICARAGAVIGLGHLIRKKAVWGP